MKKDYISPLAEVVRFETDEVLSSLLSWGGNGVGGDAGSGSGNTTGGSIDIGGNNDRLDFNP